MPWNTSKEPRLASGEPGAQLRTASRKRGGTGSGCTNGVKAGFGSLVTSPASDFELPSLRFRAPAASAVPTVLFLRKRRRLASAGLDFVDMAVCGCVGLWEVRALRGEIGEAEDVRQFI